MKTNIFAAIAWMLFAAGCGSGYQGMSSEVDAYRPPSYFQSLTSAPPYPEPSRAATVSPRNEARRQIAGMQQKSRKISEPFTAANPFFRPDPARFQRLSRQARSDADAAAFLKSGYTLETLEVLTLIRNPGIHGAERRVEAERQAFSQVADLDAVLEQYTAFTEGLMTGVGPMKGRDSVRMKFPFPGVTALKGQVVEQSVKAAAETLEMARRDALTWVRSTYWNLLYVRRSREIMAETLALFQRLESVADTRYKAGNTSFQDVIKVTIQRSVIEENLVTVEKQSRNLESKLLEILDLPPETALGPPAHQTPNRQVPALDRLYPLARERRQELRRMRAMVGRMARMIDIAETMILPRYSLGLSYYEDEAVLQVGPTAVKPAFADRTAAAVGAGLPKNPWFGTNDAWLTGTRRSLEALKADLEKAAADTDNRVRNAWFELDRAVREATLYQDTVVDLSRSALDVSTRGYESGAVSFADVIASYTNWLDVGLTLARKVSDIGVARAALAQAVGVSL